METNHLDPLFDSNGTARCSYCDIGLLSPSTLQVHAYKRKWDETLYSCQACGRCFLGSTKRNTQRLYPDLFDYRYFRQVYPLTDAEAEKIYLENYHAKRDVPRKAFFAALAVARERFSPPRQKIEAHQRRPAHALVVKKKISQA